MHSFAEPNLPSVKNDLIAIHLNCMALYMANDIPSVAKETAYHCYTLLNKIMSVILPAVDQNNLNAAYLSFYNYDPFVDLQSVHKKLFDITGIDGFPENLKPMAISSYESLTRVLGNLKFLLLPSHAPMPMNAPIVLELDKESKPRKQSKPKRIVKRAEITEEESKYPMVEDESVELYHYFDKNKNKMMPVFYVKGVGERHVIVEDEFKCLRAVDRAGKFKLRFTARNRSDINRNGNTFDSTMRACSGPFILVKDSEKFNKNRVRSLKEIPEDISTLPPLPEALEDYINSPKAVQQRKPTGTKKKQSTLPPLEEVTETTVSANNSSSSVSSSSSAVSVAMDCDTVPNSVVDSSEVKMEDDSEAANSQQSLPMPVGKKRARVQGDVFVPHKKSLVATLFNPNQPIVVKQEHKKEFPSVATIKAKLFENIQIVRDGNNCGINCFYLATHITSAIEAILNGKNPSTEKVRWRKPEPLKNAPHRLILQTITNEDGEELDNYEVLSSFSIRTPEGPHSQLPYSTMEEKQRIDIESTEVQKTPVLNKDIDDTLKAEAIKHGGIVFGQVTLAVVDELRERRHDHIFAFYATKTEVLYIDAQLYNGIKKTGDPFFSNLSTDQSFATPENNNPSAIYQPRCFYLIFGERRLENDAYLVHGI